MPTIIQSIATGNPPLRRSQEYAARFMQRIESLPDGVRRRIPAIYERSAIGYRYSCVEDYGCEPDQFTFYPPTWTMKPEPTTAQRNRKYREAALPLAEDVGRRALEEAGVLPEEITHVIAVSCTGFFAPGLDIELVRRLGLKPTTQRAVIGFMGCYAAFNALRVADGFCRSRPDAKVLVVCVELCTLHFQIGESLESAVVNALFSDGAAAAVVSACSEEEAGGGFIYRGSHTLLDDNSMGDMSWEIGDNGFLMGLTSRVPGVIGRHLPDYVRDLARAGGFDAEDITFWAIHPGGRAIVDKACEVLDLSEEVVEHSLGVLFDYGNMSSPTILFVLKRFLEDHRRSLAAGAGPLGPGVALAFGPGLTLEGAAFEPV
jgi:alpha-pyrone synthase